MSEQVMTVTSRDHAKQVLQSEIPVVVDFYSYRCGPCDIMAPLLDALAAKFAGRVKFVKVNVEEASSIAVGYGISDIPALLFIKDGQPVDEIVGLGSRLRQSSTASSRRRPRRLEGVDHVCQNRDRRGSGVCVGRLARRDEKLQRRWLPTDGQSAARRYVGRTYGIVHGAGDRRALKGGA